MEDYGKLNTEPPKCSTGDKEELSKEKLESPYPKNPATFQKTNPNQDMVGTIPQGQTIQNKTVDKTIYHRHKKKDTFRSVFPAYGLLGKEDPYRTEHSDMSKDLHNAEPINWTNHMKTDAVKRYTEEMLKAANMRGKKK